jgi:hypothetical protein
MNVPSYIYETIATKFSAEQTEAIDRNWFTYSNGFSFSRSTKAQILREARVVFECLNSEELAG